MADKDASGPSGPSFETFLQGLRELEVVLGEPARDGLRQVQAVLVQAAAAKSRGDVAGATAAIGRAMDLLSNLAAVTDPNEAMAMRAVTQAFRTALGRREEGEARRQVEEMMRRSGAVERKPD